MLTRALRAIWRSHVRGSTRLLMFLGHASARFRTVAVRIGEATLFVDLREASSHGLFGGQETEGAERRLLRRCVEPGQIAIDVGAHWGLYTVELASQVGDGGRVFAFEPCPTVLACLKRTTVPLRNVTLFPLAASDETSVASLVVPRDASMASLTNWTHAGGERREYLVDTVRLDDLLRDGKIQPADFVKCDVEGAEALVFKGAGALFDRPDAPVVMFEFNVRAAAAFGLAATAAVEALLAFKAAQYRFFVLDETEKLVLLSENWDRAWNVFAVPASRVQWLRR